MKICLNMIVKNEVANLMRCFNSVLPVIDSWNIVDTGSTDGTPDFIRGYFSSRGIHGLLHHVPFENFSQARNAALTTVRNSNLEWDYLLLTDADMELVIDRHTWRDELTGACHDVLQRQGHISYWNVRFIRRDCPGVYHGVTHEYFGANTEGHVTGVWYRDHATGGCRGDKSERDIRLLQSDLAAHPTNERSWFYLGQSLKDAGRYTEAIEAYKKRVELGGWAEENWYAKWMIAKCYKDLKDEGNYIKWCLDAYNDRPWRAEPLYDVANYYRHHGKNQAALCFINRALNIPYPHQDLLFVEEAVYKVGLTEELSISGFYDDRIKPDARRACDKLALSREVPEYVRNQARTNLFHYLQPLITYAPSFSAKQIKREFPPPYVAMNPSIVEYGSGLVVNVRTVNYRINDEGRYVYPDGDPFIRTRNWIYRINHDLTVSEPLEVIWDAPITHGEVIGLEDIRLWPDGEDLWGSATVLQLHPGHPRQMVKFRLVATLDSIIVIDLEEISPPSGIEKNWMPIIGQPGRFIYSMDHIWDGGVRRVSEPKYAAEHFRGGGQCVPFEGGYLAIVHEAMNHQHYAQRMYAHRFVWLDSTFSLSKVSIPFVFFDRQIEFAAGLVAQGEKILISFGVRDREAWIAHIYKDDVRGMFQL